MSVEIQLGSTLAGFHVERLLGRGAMGAVYLAEDVHLRRKVALKVLAREFAEDERFRRRFLLESQLAASLEHPHIVPIYAAGEEGDVLFLAMKYVEGYDLRELIDATDRVGDERAVRLLAQVADALDSAHGLGLVHRDVKPANVLIGAGELEHAYLCDFGLARHASTAASLTSDRGFVGTIAYVAPEQVEGGPVDARADVYALGCVLFECLTGRPPFERGGDLQVVFAHLKEPPPLVTPIRPDLSEAIDAVVQKALAKSPDERPSTCAELIAETVDALQVAPPAVAHAARRTVAGVRTFLITDVRGYTSYTAEHGDEAAAELASGFAEIVRRVVEERDGRLIELRGDEALVVFDSARQALRSAVELQAQVVEAGLPRGIGIGLDAGEAVPVGEGYRGGALNLAARLCSLAAAGETLASETVLQLARAVEGIRYGERRVERVKGIAKPVTAVEVLPADRRISRWDRRRLGRSFRRTARRPAVRLAAVGFGVAIAAALAVLTLSGSSPARAAVKGRSIGVISPEGKIKSQFPVGASGDLGLLDGKLWLANFDDKVFAQVDTKNHRLVHPFITLENGFNGDAFGGHAIWAVDAKEPTLLKIDPQYGTVSKRIALPADPSQIDFTAPTGALYADGSVWVAEANKVFRVHPTPPYSVKAIDVPQADQVFWGNGKIWVVSDNTATISVIDPSINQVVHTVKLPNWINALAVGGGFVWATVIPDDTVWKIDEDGNVDRTFTVGHVPGSVAWFDSAIWVASDGKLSRIDPKTDGVTDYPIVDRPQSLTVGDGVLYVSTGQSPPSLTPLPADQVANFNLAEDWVDDTDPAHAFPNPYRAQLFYATGAQLLNYPDAPAPRGSQLRPEVAAAMPAVSDGGRTYTFRLRPGYRFSPPSNASVTAETFRSSIERALSPGLGSGTPGIALLGDVVGAREFNAGKAAHVSGISVHGNTLRIRLTAPAGDFLARLSMPNFAAVPIGTPVVDGGVQTPIPSAGPYAIKVSWQDALVTLERNPNYHGPRPHRLARIVYDIGNGTNRTVHRIESGAADYSADLLGDSTFKAGGPLAERYPATGQGAPRLVQAPQVGQSMLIFNTARGPFTDVRLRKAANYALDRSALARVRGETAADGYLPPAFARAQTGVYPLKPNLPRARRLSHGFRGKVVLYACTRPDCTAIAQTVRANLAGLGMTVDVRQLDDPYSEANKPRPAYDMLLMSWSYDWPDPGGVLNQFLPSSSYRLPWAPHPVAIPAASQRELAHAAAVPPPARAAAYARVAKRLERDAAPFAVFSTPALAEFYSARIGCVVEQPVLGVADIGALCVKP